MRSKSVESAPESRPPWRWVSQSPERIATPIALQPSGRQRLPERPHRGRPRLALELPDRRHADEDERDRAADPDRGREQVNDAEGGQHAPRLSSRPMSENGILFLHLAGVLVFVGGSIAAAVLRLAAMRRERPSEIALLLRAVRPAVPLVAGGLVLAIGAGFWLAHRLGFALSRHVAHAHVRADRLDGRRRRDRRAARTGRRASSPSSSPRDRDAPDAGLGRRLRDPVNLLLNASMLVAIVAVVALMVWKPGA